MTIPGSFWSFNVGHVGVAAVAMFGWGMTWSSNNSMIAQLRKDHDLLAAEVHPMDARGTHASQKGIYEESETSKSNGRRLDELDREWREASPKLERIDANLQWMMKVQGVQPQK